MSLVERGVRLAASTLPATIRDRYREQWLADLRDAPELGLSTLGIVVGAFVFSLRLGRTAEVRGYSVTELMMRRLRWGLALVVCAPVVFIALWMTGALVTEPGSIGATLVLLAGVATLVTLLVGFWLLLAAARSANRTALVGVIIVAVGLLGVAVPAVLAMVVPAFGLAYGDLSLSIPFLLMTAVVGLFFVLLGFTRGLATVEVPVRVKAGPTTSRIRARSGVIALLGLASLLAFGAYELLVLSPLAQAPDYSISEIYAMLSPQDRMWGVNQVVVWVVFWGVVSLALFALCLARGRFATAFNILLTPRRLAVYALLLGSVMLFFQGWAGFSLGMSIADTIYPYSGGRSWQGAALSALGAAMFVAGTLLALVPGKRRAVAHAASGPAPALA